VLEEPADHPLNNLGAELLTAGAKTPGPGALDLFLFAIANTWSAPAAMGYFHNWSSPVLFFAACALLLGCKAPPVQAVTQQPTVAPEVTAKLDTIIKAQGDVQSTVTSALTTFTSAVTTSVQKQDALESKLTQTVGTVDTMLTSVNKIDHDLSANQLSLANETNWRLGVLGLIVLLIGVILPAPPMLVRLVMLGLVAAGALALILL
jgi:hypothetical protein